MLPARAVFGQSVDVFATQGGTSGSGAAAGDVDSRRAGADAARVVFTCARAAVDVHWEHELGGDVCGDVCGGSADGDSDVGVRRVGEGQGDTRCRGDARVQRRGRSARMVFDWDGTESLVQFVYPRVNPVRRDVAVMTHESEMVNVWE